MHIWLHTARKHSVLQKLWNHLTLLQNLRSDQLVSRHGYEATRLNVLRQIAIAHRFILVVLVSVRTK